MEKKLFTSNAFRIILTAIIGINLFIAIAEITYDYGTISILILRSLNLIICIAALVSLFIISKYSLSILKLYIFYKWIFFPAAVILYGLKDYLFYLASPFEIDVYITMSVTILFGMVLYYFFRKYKVQENPLEI